MPVQAPPWTEYLSCPVCENGFDPSQRLPVSLGCGHTICKTCLSNLQRHQCPFDLCPITIDLEELPVNSALVLLIDSEANLSKYRRCKHDKSDDEEKNYSEEDTYYDTAMQHLEKLAVFLRTSINQQVSRPMQRKLVTLINCQPLEEEGRARAIRASRSLGERSVTELILQHQNPQQLSINLWAAVRTRGCQFLGPAMQEEVLKLVLLALEDGSALSRKVLVMFVVQRLETQFPQASKTSIGHVVQLLYRASCFKVTKRDGDSSLMQLKEEFRTYDTLRREHDAQIVQIATEAGLRIAPDQWSSLLYGDSIHKSHMQSIIDKLQTPQSFLQSVQELLIALQRTGDPGQLTSLRGHLDLLSSLDPNGDYSDWKLMLEALNSSREVVSGLLAFVSQYSSYRRGGGGGGQSNNLCEDGGGGQNYRYKTSMCRDLSLHSSCPRGKNCTFAHSPAEVEQNRSRNARPFSLRKKGDPSSEGHSQIGNYSSFRDPNLTTRKVFPTHHKSGGNGGKPTTPEHKTLGQQFSIRVPPLVAAVPRNVTPVAQVAPLPRGYDPGMQQQTGPSSTVRYPTANERNSLRDSLPLEAYGGRVQGGVSHVQLPVNVQQLPTGTTLIQQGLPAAQIQVHYPSPMVPPQVVFQHSPQILPVQQEQIQPPPDQHQQVFHYHQVEADIWPRNQQQKCLDLTGPGGLEADKLLNAATSSTIDQSARVATKSLSALKSRKEEIIVSLEDILGKEEAEKITELTSERADAIDKTISAPEKTLTNSAYENGSSYSLWTTKAFTAFTFSDEVNSREPNHQGTEAMALFSAANDEVVPFTDSPQISRFGPIARRYEGDSITRGTKPSQSQAIIQDEVHSTPVVTNSKQMSRPAPSIHPPTAFLHQNGTLTALQPVAVGANGEIGYITVPQPPPEPNQTPEYDLRYVHGASLLQPQQPEEISSFDGSDSSNLYADAEKMKHELEILQRKISNLNLARMSTQGVTGSNGIDGHPLVTNGNSEENDEKYELTNELQLIENSIRDREREISLNHIRPCDDIQVSDGSKTSVSLGVIVSKDEDARSLSITTTARSGHVKMANGCLYETL